MNLLIHMIQENILNLFPCRISTFFNQVIVVQMRQ